ncbi:hypothetical protein N9C47_04315 [Flavobacteriaceae bacterium]|jgi:hypothetical protein|nr:hypothetical protein [Flavobacteriaceae bacterium]MDA9844057.1 hypothetical protein [Flavobacteriaceae bacterium]
MKNFIKSNLFTAILLCLTLGLAPFTPEPHLFGKIQWVLGGGEGMAGMDVFDLFLHGAPWVWLLYSLVKELFRLAKNK